MCQPSFVPQINLDRVHFEDGFTVAPTPIVALAIDQGLQAACRH